MTGKARRPAGRDTSRLGGSAALGAASVRPPPSEPTLDKLLAEPIVQRLMHRDGIDETTTRRLLQQVAAARAPARRHYMNDSDDWRYWRVLKLSVEAVIEGELAGDRLLAGICETAALEAASKLNIPWSEVGVIKGEIKRGIEAERPRARHLPLVHREKPDDDEDAPE